MKEQNIKTTSTLSFRPSSRNLEKNKATLFPGSRIKSGITAEGGRSMVEMLGVLAIIGVISIGAIGGYTYGMNRYRTNEILDGGNKRAYTVATQLSMGLQPNLSEFKDYNTTAGGTFGDTEGIKQWDGEFGISISGVTKPVCENLIRMIGDNTPLRALSKGEGENETELTAGDCAEGNNDIYLVYNIGDIGGSSGGGGYCSTHECNRNCGGGTNNCSYVETNTGAYNEIDDTCGGKGNVATLEDLGCNYNETYGEGSCSQNYNSVWTYDSAGFVYVINNSHTYRRGNGTTGDYSAPHNYYNVYCK